MANILTKKCLIVASGLSAKDLVLPDNVDIIAVNSAIKRTGEKAKFWFTLDPHKNNKKLMRDRVEGVVYYAAATKQEFLPSGVIRLPLIEGKRRKQDEPADKSSAEWFLWRYRCKLGLSPKPFEISNGNSAYGALNLAKHLGYKDIALAGVDSTGSYNLEGGRGLYKHIHALFESVNEPELNIVSLGVLDCFPQMKIEKWLAL